MNPKSLTVNVSAGGTVTGAGKYDFNSDANLTATPAPGYLFGHWSGALSSSTNPTTVKMTENLVVNATFAQDLNDNDGDGLTNYREIVELSSDPNDNDSDNDGFSDAEEDDCGTDSKSAASQPSDFDGDGLCDAKDATDDRTEKLEGQEEPGFTPGFPSVLAAISLLGAAVLGRRKED